MAHKAQHFYKGKVKKVTWLHRGAGTAGAGGCWGVQARGGQPGPQEVAVGRGRGRHGREVRGGGKLAECLINARVDLAEVQERPWLSHLLREGTGQGRIRGAMTVVTWEAAGRSGLNAPRKSWGGISTKEEMETRVEEEKVEDQVPRKGDTECPRRGGGTCRAPGTTAWEQGRRHPQASGACSPGVGGTQMGVSQAVWEVMVCSEQAENTLHRQSRTGEESRVQKSEPEGETAEEGLLLC